MGATSVALCAHGGRGTLEAADPRTADARDLVTDRPASGGRHAERVRAHRGRTRATPSDRGAREWPAPMVAEVVPTERLGAPGRIAALGAYGRALRLDRLDDGPGTPPRRSMRPRQLALTGAVALVVGLLLNAGSLERSAQTSPFGPGRSLSLAVLQPLATIAHATRLDRPRAALDSVLGHDGGSGTESVAADSLPPAGASSGQLGPLGASSTGHGLHDRPAEPAGSGPGPAAVAQAGPAAATAEAAPAAPVAARARRFELLTVGRVPSAADPLRVWVGGDSIAGYLGLGMVDLAGQRADLAVHSHYQTSTGLSRPDYYDWPAHLEEDMHHFDPEVVVLLVGGNDDQAVTTAGGSVADFAGGAWTAEYGRRVGAVMDRLVSEHRMVVWIGLPAMRSADFDQHMQVMNSVYRAQAAQRPGVLFVDSRPVMSDGGGSYAPYLKNASGQQVLMRAADGIHLSPDGGRRLASNVLDIVLQTLRADDVELPVAQGPW